MNILFVGELNPAGRGYQRYRAFKEMGHAVLGCSLVPQEQDLGHKPSLWQRLRWRTGFPADGGGVNAKMLEEARLSRADLIWVEKGNIIRPATLARAKDVSYPVRLVSFSEDDMFSRHNRSWYYTEGLKHYDIVFTTKSYNCASDELPALGAKRVIFVDKAFDRHAHRPMPLTEDEVRRFGADIGFIGTYEESRANSMLYLAQNGLKVRVWGTGWGSLASKHPNLIVENRGLYGDDYCRGICATRINLCFLRKANRDLQTDRTMEIPACGAFMLAERTPEHLRLFQEDEEAAYFSSNQELLEKAGHFLANEASRRRIATAARMRCEKSGYSHHERLRWMLDQICADGAG